MEIDINSREKLITALEQAGRSQLRKKKARLREIYDWVLLAKSNDLDEKTIIQLLATHGLHFSRSGFAVTMHRIKKELESETAAGVTRPARGEAANHRKPHKSHVQMHPSTPISVVTPRQAPSNSTESQVKPQNKTKSESATPEQLRGILSNKLDLNQFRNDD